MKLVTTWIRLLILLKIVPNAPMLLLTVRNVLSPVLVHCYAVPSARNVNLILGWIPQVCVFRVQLCLLIAFHAQMILCVNNVKTTLLPTCTMEPVSNALILNLNATDAHIMELESLAHLALLAIISTQYLKLVFSAQQQSSIANSAK